MSDGSSKYSEMPRWVWKAALIFWLVYLVASVAQQWVGKLWGFGLIILVSLFLALAIEPGVNHLAARGWRRGSATALFLLGVLVAFGVFVGAIASMVGEQIAELLGNSETYVTKTVTFLNDTFNANITAKSVIDSIQDPDGPVQRFIRNQQGRVVDLSVAALGFLVQLLTVMLFTFYLVADGPKLRRAICSRLRPDRQRTVLAAWEVAIDKTGGYLYSRALLAGVSTVFHWIVLTAMGTRAPLALALWVGLISQFLPVIGTYMAGALPVLITFIDSPFRALLVLGAVIIYQQIENYVLLPRITARTMDLHPAIAFGSALVGGALLGAVGAILAIPGAAMVQALLKDVGPRHEVIETKLTTVGSKRRLSARKWGRVKRTALAQGAPIMQEPDDDEVPPAKADNTPKGIVKPVILSPADLEELG